MPESEQDMHHTLPPAVRHHGGTLHQNGWGARTEGHHIEPEVLECKITHFHLGLQGIYSRHYRLDPG
jgi:hypothetical protein